MEKDSGRKHQEIENQMYMVQGRQCKFLLVPALYLLMIAIEKIL